MYELQEFACFEQKALSRVYGLGWRKGVSRNDTSSQAWERLRGKMTSHLRCFVDIKRWSEARFQRLILPRLGNNLNIILIGSVSKVNLCFSPDAEMDR